MNFIALRSVDFRLYFLGGVAAVNAMWILRILISWLAWDMSGSATYVGVIAAASLLPTVFFSPIAGVFVDRTDIRKAAYGTNISMVVCLCVLYALHANGALGPVTLVGIAAAVGLVTAVHHPIRLSFGPRLVPAQYVSSVVALGALNFNLARLLSPAIGGLLIDWVGISAALLLILTLFLPNLAILYRLRPRSIERLHSRESFFGAFLTGVSYMWQRPAVRLVLLASLLFAISIRGVLEILPIVADGVFTRGPVGLGQLGSAVGGGALIAALVKTMARIDARPGRSILSARNISASIIGMIAVAVLGTATAWPVALAAGAVLGFCGTFLGVGMQSLIQRELPDDMRGRVMSIWIVVGLGGTAFGAFAIGAVSEFVGLPVTSLTTCGLGLVATILLVQHSRNARKKREAKGLP
ncbi:MAG: MFS transporter [Rhodobacteraceae bacterium]|nr:MFS transporter [Paracoccaceae bacterium]